MVDETWSEDARQLEEAIKEFEVLVNSVGSILSPIKSRLIDHPHKLFSRSIHDWRPVWDQSKLIQERFKSGVRYPTRALRDQAWTRFNDLRNKASAEANSEREALFEVSQTWRDLIFKHVKFAEYSKMNDVLFFFDPTTVEDMKQKSRTLKEAGEMLAENKHQMLREHKDECFHRFQEIRATHDAFWEQYREHREKRMAEYQERIEGVLAKIETNIAANEERKTKAEEALRRTEANIERLSEMLASARSEDFQDRVSGWLAEAEEKRDSIQETLRRLDEWIDQEKRRRSDIYAKRR